MDQIARLMNRYVPLEKILVPTGQVDGRMLVEPHRDNEYDKFIRTPNLDQSSNYAEEYRKKEEAMYMETCRAKDDPSQQEGAMSMVETADDLLSAVGKLEVDALKQEQSREVFTKYDFEKHKNQQLTIHRYREAIMNLVETSDVVIIQGPTGCGKTTQVPQFILDHCRKENRFCRIVVTQPRRIAAISVARRVCEERNWSLGTVCGYQVGLDRNIGSNTLLSYVTTGVLLHKLISQKNLLEYSHIIIDEVHERTQDMDFLLLIIRKFLNTNSMGVKIILMSATFTTEAFAHYFKNYNSLSRLVPAPVVFIQKDDGSFHTQTFYIDQLRLLGIADPNQISEPKIDKSVYRIFSQLIRTFDKLDVKDPITNIHKIESVLVFLPGIVEIEEAHGHLQDFNKLQMEAGLKSGNNYVPDWEIIPLHSSITTEQQRKVFIPPSPRHRRIILSTNIAESSITVPDVGYVVDFCLTKTMVVDCDTQYQSLQLQWASHVNCTQRAGRVGRVSDGRVYRLVTRPFYEYHMPKTVTPEILRAPLANIVLKSKMLNLCQPPKAILALALDPPNLANIDATVLFLKEIGALAMTCGSDVMTSDGDITFLGRVMAMLPLDAHLSKFIFLGFMYSCLEECIIMATGCSLNIFKSPFKERLKAYTNRLQWADGSASDVIAYLNLYRVWQRKKRMSRDKGLEIEWCRQNFVSLKTLREWEELVTEVTRRLKQMGIQVCGGPAHVTLSQTELPTVVKIVICGAFYPNYFKRSSDGGQVNEREAVKTLNGHDPCSTIYFTGFDPHQPGPLYSKLIKECLQDCGMYMQVFFDYSSKVYVQFLNSNQRESVKVDGEEFCTSMPGRIRSEVYRAIRKRQLRIEFAIPLLQTQAAWELAESLGITRPSPGMGMLPIMAKAKADAKMKVEEEENYDDEEHAASHVPVLPAMDVQFIRIRISEIIDAGHFWAHNADECTANTLMKITKILHCTKESLEKVDPKSIKCGSLYAARYKMDGLFYRCKVVALTVIDKKQMQVAQIIFIDYGNTDTLGLHELFKLPKDECMSGPAQAMECFLSEIQPSEVLNHKCLWSEKANRQLNVEQQYYGKVYSVVQDIVHLELYFDEGRGYNLKDPFNQFLVKKGYAQPAEESFLSKENHEQRQQILANPDKMAAFMKKEEPYISDPQDFEPPSLRDCGNSLRLKGPFSPLEMQIYSVVASGQSKQIVVEGNSVNAVLLDTHAQDPHERLMVAGYIGQNVTATALTLRHTTLMPNIHGLPMLVSLLFCPTMETKPTADGSRFGAILCGLGGHKDSDKPLYPHHDICLTLDTDLTTDDLNQINALRYWMNMAVAMMEANYNQVDISGTIDNCHRELKTRLFDLLKKERKSVERVFIKHADVWGQCLYNSELLIPGEDGQSRLKIWPLHTTMKLNESDGLDPSVTNHITELQEIALRMRTVNEIHCRFCDQMFYSAGALRVHMHSENHLKAMSAINKTMVK